MRPTLLSALGLVLGIGAAAAAPVPTQNQNPPAKAKKVTVNPGYPAVSAAITPACRDCLEGDSCTPAQKASCKSQVEDILEAHWDATSSTPKIPLMKIGLHEIPRDLAEGKYFKYNQPRSTFTTMVWPKGKVEAMPVDRLGKVSATAAAKAHRQPQWDENGQKIASCEEYAYEEMYDVMRFLDAGNACRGDRDCVMDVAYKSSTPGIAGRRLNRKDGEALTPFGPFPNQLDPYKGQFPKNEMFQLGATYLYSNGKPGEHPEVPRDPELEAWLATGQKFYSLGSATEGTGSSNGGSGPLKNGFVNEWEWHKTMRKRTADVSDAEREEYELRLAKFRELTAQHAAAVAAFEAHRAELTEPKEHELVLPYDMQTSDIFERYDRVAQIREYVQRARVRVDKAIKKGTIKQNVTQPAVPQQTHQNGGVHQQHVETPKNVQQHGARGSTSPVAVLGFLPPASKPSQGPMPTQGGSGAGAGKAKKATKSTAKLSPCLQGSDDEWGIDAHGHGRLSCRIGEFLREEWARKKAGRKSCLDKNNYDCDWKPQTFTTRVLDKIPDIDKYKFFVTRCNAWTSGTFSPPAANLDAAKAIIDQAELEIGAARQALEPYYKGNNDHGRKYAGEWGEDKTYGKKDWFGADLGFEAGWDVAAAAKTGGNNNVCALQGGMKGKLNAKAYLAFFDPELVRGDVYTEVNKSGAPGKARFKSQLTILGDEVYKKPDGSGWVTSQIVEEGPLAFQSSPRASFTVPIGGVPITGSLWGEMGLGYVVKGKGSSPSGCDVNSTAFSVTGGFGPVLSAVGNASVGVGIAGIVSAGISVALTIIRIELPLSVEMKMKSGSQPKLVFGSSLDLLLSTLSGRLSLYIEFLFFTEEWELFRWSGIGPATVHLMPQQNAELPMSGMRP